MPPHVARYTFYTMTHTDTVLYIQSPAVSSLIDLRIASCISQIRSDIGLLRVDKRNSTIHNNRVYALKRQLYDAHALCLKKCTNFDDKGDENHASHCPLKCPLFRTFSTSPLMLYSVQSLSGKSCYKLPSVVTFTFIQFFNQNFVFLLNGVKFTAFA